LPVATVNVNEERPVTLFRKGPVKASGNPSAKNLRRALTIRTGRQKRVWIFVDPVEYSCP